MTKVLVTGASGFVGTALVRKLADIQNLEILACSRNQSTNLPTNVRFIAAPNLTPEADWTSALVGIDCLVHTAARVHLMQASSDDALSMYRNTNIRGTLNLAEQAAIAGVRRFIFLSSAKVCGECTSLGNAFVETVTPAPEDAYAISKLEAEQGLREVADQMGMDVVTIRPPLIYGPGVKGNFLRLMLSLSKGIPLPFGAVRNLRSLVALGNVVDLIALCIAHPASANETFLVSDGEDMSTAELLRRLGDALGRPARLISVPVWLLKPAATLLGKSNELQRLCRSLQVDIGKARKVLGWEPPINCREALRITAEDFLNNKDYRLT